jgi:YidC/Oxa1 family membrane protein insertase
MDKNSVIGIVLIGALLIGYTIYQKPNEAQLAADRRVADSLATLNENAVNNGIENTPVVSTEILADTTDNDSLRNLRMAGLTAKYGVLAPASEGTETFHTVTTDKFEVTFSSKGGVPVRAKLNKYTTYSREDLYLMTEHTSRMGYKFVYPSIGLLSTSDFYFESRTGKDKVSGDETTQFVYTLALGDGRSIENIYTLTGSSDDIAIETKLIDAGSIFTEPKLVWELSGLHNEKGIEAERNNSTIFFKEQGSGRDYLSETGSDDDVVSSGLEWIAFKQNFFSVALLGNEAFGAGTKIESRPFEEENDSLTQYYFAEIPVKADASTAFAGKLFIGPNDYRTMKHYGNEFDKIINLGWGIFGWVNKYIVILIFDWLETTGMSYGIIILILTLIIKTLLAPLTWKNYLSSAKMRVLKPEIDELNEKHKDADPMKKQQATMELYRKTGVNPFAGCLPMLVQLPILYAMFRFFPSSIQLRHEPFLWADDLSSYDSIASLPFEIPAYGAHVSLFTLLMAASTFVYTMFNSSSMPTTNQPGMPNMKVIMYIFPFMMLFFFNKFSSGLSYYYFLANVISIGQMILIKRFFIDEDKIRLQIAENKKKKVTKGKSKFQQKLEDIAKQRGISPK